MKLFKKAIAVTLAALTLISASRVVSLAEEPEAYDFQVTGATELKNIYVINRGQDKYSYDKGFRTILYTDDVDPSSLTPVFIKNDDISSVYATPVGSGDAGTPQTSGVSKQDFSDWRAVQYIVNFTDKTTKNYWVTFVKKSVGEVQLFVNGINGPDGARREVHFTSSYNNGGRSLLVVNVGDSSINIALDMEDEDSVISWFWNVLYLDYLLDWLSGDFLPAFGDNISTGDDPPNFAIIDLYPTLEGLISETLIIKSSDEYGNDLEPIFVEIVGGSGDAWLTTDTSLPEAVKYVPYAFQLAQNNNDPNVVIKLSLVSGSLPDGMSFEGGEISGAPKEAGKFIFTVRMEREYVPGYTPPPIYAASIGALDDEPDVLDEREYALIVNDNTDDAVNGVTDNEYAVDQGYYIGKKDETGVYVIDNFGIDQVFVSVGDLSEFRGCWLDGNELEKDEDYIAESGSTKITIRGQTFANKIDRTIERHTFAAEFQNGANELKRTAQNFRVSLSVDSGDGGSGDGGSSGGNPVRSGSGGGGSAPLKAVAEPARGSEPRLTITAPASVLEYIKEKSGARGIIQNGKITADVIYIAKKTPENEPVVAEASITGLGADINEAYVSISSQTVNDMAAAKDVSFRVNVENLGIITLNGGALNYMAAQGGKTVEIGVSRTGGETTVKISVDGAPVSKIKGGVRVMLPGFEDGEALVLVKVGDGGEIVKKCVVEGGYVYALLDGACVVKVIENARSFSDISASEYKYSILFAGARDIMTGVSASEFAPDKPMTRAMMATALHRLENSENPGVGSLFSDVSADAWYSNGVAWAANNGIAFGYEDGAFMPDNNLTWEQMVAFMRRYDNYIGAETVARGDARSFEDEASPWAKSAVRWASGAGLLDDAFSPKVTVFRGQAAEIIRRFISALVK
ncbi:MAG: S-layer homology domain-containing protein [Clostridiales bacterium]|jgi:hypothetical protein|nr:S-layer homology domain-containing protein [Clostridiales bacterium]